MTDTTRDPALDATSVVPITTDATGGPEAPLSPPTKGEKARSLGTDAWADLRHRPMFWISAALIMFFVIMAAFPQLFTNTDPYLADLAKARKAPSPDAWFGRDNQGYDVYARTIYGARASILVGIFASLFVALLGSFVGVIAGYRAGWMDSVLSRIGEIFLGIPLLLGGILFLYLFPSDPLTTPFLLQVAKVAFVLGILGWPVIMRLMRGSVLQVKPNDYVQAARALGASPTRIIGSHILPNSLASVIVVSTINLGVYISVEATLSFLGVGLQPPAISWGIQISEASGIGMIRAAPHMLFFPSLFLSLTVLAFIMMGDVVRDALDPRLR
ncbi:MAG TPA: ABC transporter permease [Propionibacteriaceae bacterium]|nr:ABC transporter permease [Propionibacteriaceae bacterium]